MENNIHSIQANILKVLLYKPEAKFGDLNVDKISTDHFNFHVKRLSDLNLIEKSSNGFYSLTIIGKEFANRLDTDSAKVILEKQAKIGVLIGCVQGKGKNKKYLIQQRLKQPFYGYYGFMTGKVKWGEKVEETAKRELEEETGLSAKLSLIAIKHKMDYGQKDELLEDKYFFVFKGEDVTGELKENFEGGRNLWLTPKEIFKIDNLFDGVDETITFLNQNKLKFAENKYKVSGY